jgi:hypothetical protein
VVLAHDYDADVEIRRYSRLYREESAIAFSAIDCVLKGVKGIYASSELTTGKRMYTVLEERGLRRASELDAGTRDALLAANVAGAEAFARRLQATLSNELVITPAPFSAPGWTQAEYLAFWEELIRTRVKSVVFNAAWEYSNGCAFEFAVACEAGLELFDAELLPVPVAEGIDRLAAAAADLETKGYDAQRLRLTLNRLR